MFRKKVSSDMEFREAASQPVIDVVNAAAVGDSRNWDIIEF